MANEISEGLPRRVDALDRPGQAAQNLFLGDLDAGFRAMFQPKELTPGERDAFLKRLGLDKKPYDGVFRTLTNPLLIISLALSHKFPIPAAGNMFKLSERVGSLTSRFPILRRFASMQALFRGTDVPDTLGKIIFDVNDFRSRYGSRMGELLTQFRNRTGRLPTARDQVMISSWLDGLHKPLRGFQGKNGVIRMGSGETTRTLPGVGTLMPGLPEKMGTSTLELAQGVRKVLDDQWAEVFGTIQGRKAILQAIRRQRGAGFADDTTAVMEEFLKDPKKIADYFPRRILQTEEDFKRLVGIITQSASSKRFAKSAQRKAQAWATPEVYKRKFQTVPDGDDLDIVGDLVDVGARAKMDAVVKARVIHEARVAGMNTASLRRLDSMPLKEMLSEYPKTLQAGEVGTFAAAIADHKPRSYSLKLVPVLSSYNHTLAGTFGWTVRGGGSKMTAVLEDLKELGKTNPNARARADMLENTYIPIAMGRQTFRQSIRAQTWQHSMIQLGNYLENPKIKGLLGDRLTKRLQDGMSASRGGFSLLNLQRKAAGYFYLSTLGLNPGSALKNTLQLVLTTGPTIGFRTTAAGLERAFSKSHKYFALRLGPRKLSHDAAIRDTYPEFAKAGLQAAPITEEVVQNSLLNAYEIAALPAAGTKLADKINRAMMSMFTASETTVRLATFEGGMLHAARSGITGDKAIEFARKLVEQTQFLTGPQNTPFFLLDRSPVIRQLTQFPLRALEFATSTALTLGSGEKAGLLGLNPGTFARMVAGSVIALELGDAMGISTGDALLGGALPTFAPAGRVLAPLPIVPPIIQIVGAAGIGLASQDFSELVQASPLLVPGGVALARVAGLLPRGVPGSQIGQQAARALGRTFADYSAPAPDGRIAVYTGKGTLRGFYRPWELVKMGLGVKGGDLESESQLLQTLVSQRDQIREARVQYLDARYRNDARSANGIVRGFKQRFGFDLPVSSKDVRAMQLRKQITRLEQVVRTLPPGEARDQMVRVIASTLGSEGQTLLGIDPAVLGQPQQAREAARAKIPRRGSARGRFQARTDLGPTDQINPQTIGRLPGTATAQPPF